MTMTPEQAERALAEARRIYESDTSTTLAGLRVARRTYLETCAEINAAWRSGNKEV